MALPLVLNKYKLLPGQEGVFIGRGSPWGNPHKANAPTEREWRCDQFEAYAWQLPRRFILQAVDALAGRCVKCYCAPKRCHGDRWVMIVNNQEYIDKHYPDHAIGKENTIMNQTMLTDLEQLKHINPELMAAYGVTAPKLIKDKKLLSKPGVQAVLKRYCSQLAMFNIVLCQGETSYSCYHHQYYFIHYIDVVAAQSEVRFDYADLLGLHLASMLFFNTLVTAQAGDRMHEIKEKQTLLDKYTPPNFSDIRVDMITRDAVMMPGTETSIGRFQMQFNALL